MTISRSQPSTTQYATTLDEVLALRSQLASARKALELAEDVLSRAPFSTGIWPNGMHPNAGIEQIRAALKEISK